MLKNLIKYVKLIWKRALVFVDVKTARRHDNISNPLYDNKFELKKNKLLIYVAHIHGLRVPDFVERCIDLYMAEGYDVIFVITFSGVDLKTISDLVSSKFNGIRILIRKNFGKDFGGIADAMCLIDGSNVTYLALHNDSMIGPLDGSDLIPLAERSDFDFYGVTESFFPKYHIQSSILFFKGQAVKFFIDFVFNKYKIYRTRDNIVNYGEVGLTQYMLGKPLRIGALLPVSKLISGAGGKTNEFPLAHINPQHDFGLFMLTECNFPYIKRELISQNPAGKDIDWTLIREKIGVEGIELISDALKNRI